MTVLLYLVFFAILFGVGAWVAASVRRRVAQENRRRATIVVWLAILAIPFWDLIPTKVYFYAVCRDAGVEILDKSYDKEVYYTARLTYENEYKPEQKNVIETETLLPFGVLRRETTYLHPDTRKPLMLYRSYGVHLGWQNAYWKPWLAGYCPGPHGPDVSLDVRRKPFNLRIEELQK